MTDPKPVLMQSREQVVADMKESGLYAEPIAGEPIMGIGGTLGHTYAKPEQLTRQAIFGITDAERDSLAAQGIRVPANHNARLAAEDAAIAAKRSAAETAKTSTGPDSQVAPAKGTNASPLAGPEILGVGRELGNTDTRPEQSTREALLGTTKEQRAEMETKGARLSATFGQILSTENPSKPAPQPKLP